MLPHSFTKPYSEETARIIDEEVSAVIERAYERAKDILSSHRDKLEALADSLLQNEVIFREDVERILGARPFKKDKELAPPSPEAAKESAPEADTPEEGPSEDPGS